MFEPTSIHIGVALVATGTLITGYHATQLFQKGLKDTVVRRHLSYALVGIVLFNIGNNLIANGIHDHLRKKN